MSLLLAAGSTPTALPEDEGEFFPRGVEVARLITAIGTLNQSEESAIAALGEDGNQLAVLISTAPTTLAQWLDGQNDLPLALQEDVDVTWFPIPRAASLPTIAPIFITNDEITVTGVDDDRGTTLSVNIAASNTFFRFAAIEQDELALAPPDEPLFALIISREIARPIWISVDVDELSPVALDTSDSTPLVVSSIAQSIPALIFDTDTLSFVIADDDAPVIATPRVISSQIRVFEDHENISIHVEEEWPLPPLVVVYVAPSVAASTFWTLDDNAFNVVLDDPYSIVLPLITRESRVQIIEDNDIAPGVLEEDWPLVIPIVIPATPSVVASTFWTLDDNAFNVVLEDPYPLVLPINVIETRVQIIEDNDIAPGVLEEDWPLAIPIVVPQTGSSIAQQLWQDNEDLPKQPVPPPPPTPSGGGGGGGSGWRYTPPYTYPAPKQETICLVRTKEDMLEEIFEQVLEIEKTEQKKPATVDEIKDLFDKVDIPTGCDPLEAAILVVIARNAYIQTLQLELAKERSLRIAAEHRAIRAEKTPWITIGISVVAGAFLYKWLQSPKETPESPPSTSRPSKPRPRRPRVLPAKPRKR